MKNIIYEDEHILVAFKPAGIATETKRVGQQDMVSEIRNYLYKKDKQAGEPYVGLVHRLDQPVSGLIVFAKTKSAASALSKQVNDRKFKKNYYAVVMGKPKKDEDTLTDYLYKDPRTNMSAVVDRSHPDSKKAVLSYRVVKTLWALEDDTEATLLDIDLQTGRHHQIRVQLSNAGIPILGDTKYGSITSKDFSKDVSLRNIALCAYRLRFDHPATGREMTFERKPEDEIFKAFLG